MTGACSNETTEFEVKQELRRLGGIAESLEVVVVERRIVGVMVGGL